MLKWKTAAQLHTHTHTHTLIHTSTHTHIHTHILTNIYTYIYIYIYSKTRSWVMAQKIFCLRHITKLSLLWLFNFNTFPNRRLIFKLVQNFEAHDSSEDCWATRSSPSGPPINHPGGMYTCYQQLCTLHSTVSLTVLLTSGACT